MTGNSTPLPCPVNATTDRRRWIKQFMLGSAMALGASGWRGTLLADISPNTPASDILPLPLGDFPGLLDGSAPSVQLQLSYFDEVIMINRAPFNGNLYVLDSKCTHQGCIVGKWDVNGNILCPCHGSNYSIDGSLIYGAAGPFQPPLRTYNFTYDEATSLLKIQVPGLNLKINSTTVQSVNGPTRRLKLVFPGYLGADYQVNHSNDLVTWQSGVSFAITSGGSADQTVVRCQSASTPLNVWVDSTTAQGFYRIELVLNEY
jgi:nitrite reductase/ring-hydroxylating ferredoxin subunit